MLFNRNLFVITGGPGVGKTTLLRELERKGFICSREVARDIIREQVESGGDAVPWANTEGYSHLMLARSIEAYLEHRSATLSVFFDRGIPDVLCYARIINRTADEVESACHTYRYNQKVFIAPPWEEIYATDRERKQTFQEAVLTHAMMTEAYQSCGYELIELPRTSAKERAEFVIAQLPLKSESDG